MLVLRWLVLLFPVWWEIKWWRVGFLTRTLRAATMVRGSGDILVDVVASFAGVAYGGECLLGVAVWCYRCRIV